MAEILVEIGTLLELKGENPFKTRAYLNGARIIEGLNEPLKKLVEEERLGELKGIGDALQQKITELVTTGKLKYYDELKASVPAGLVAMLDIPGLGPKKIIALNKNLGVDYQGLKIFDATDVNTITNKQLAHYPGINALDIIPFNKVAMMIGSDGLYQYSYADVKSIKLLSKIAIERQ